MATGEIWLKVPPTIKFVYHGKLPKWVSGKDLILYTIGDIGVDGALYSVMEFAGEAIDELDMDGRFTMANMAIEAGAKAGIFAVDDKTEEYLHHAAANRVSSIIASQTPPVIASQVSSMSLRGTLVPKQSQKRDSSFHSEQAPQSQSNKDAQYARIYEYDVSQIEPQVAFPSLPSNTRPVSQVGEVKLDQVVIGGCTNGRISDLRVAAKLIQGREIHPDLRCIILPGSQQVYLEALREGLIEDFIKAGAVVSTPTCGPCLGGHMGVLAAGERCLSTTNRNFVGRMGSPESEVYLANPAVAAASAILGRIASPGEVTG
jgi:3-isopropylmalate/(R)-2-methylmalate dehydratase large subunit